MAVIVKLLRLAGADIIVLPSAWGTFAISVKDTRECPRVCLSELVRRKASFLALAGGKWAGTVSTCVNALKTNDFILISGTGVFSHPRGPEAGARSLVQAWEASEAGVEIELYAHEKKELREALSHFRGRIGPQ